MRYYAHRLHSCSSVAQFSILGCQTFYFGAKSLDFTFRTRTVRRKLRMHP